MAKKAKQAPKSTKSSASSVNAVFAMFDGTLVKAPTHGRYSYLDNLLKASQCVVTSDDEAIIDKLAGLNCTNARVVKALKVLRKTHKVMVHAGTPTTFGTLPKNLAVAKERLAKIEHQLFKFLVLADSEASKYYLKRNRSKDPDESKQYGIAFSLWSKIRTELDKTLIDK